MSVGFSGGSVVKNLLANAVDAGSDLRSGAIPHASEQLSLCATTTDFSPSGVWAPQHEKPPQLGALAPQLESSPCSQQLEENPHCDKDLGRPIINK